MPAFDIDNLQKKIAKFSDERDWKQFHTPKNLSMALSVETSELMEIFQWLTPEESVEIAKDEVKFTAIKDEMADVLIYLLRMAEILKVDLESATINKIKKNTIKYPAHKSKGNSKKYTEL